jgi:hypothetical protein
MSMSTTATNLTLYGTGAMLLFNGVTTTMNSINQVHNGWMQVMLKQQDMTSQLPGMVTIPPVIGGR